MTPLLSARGLCKRFGALVVADGIDLDVLAGTIHAVIGPNGAGKTSLVNQLAGAVRPDAGRIELAGQDITHLPVHRRARLGLIRAFQITAVLPDFSALENVALAAQSRAGSSWRLFRRADAEAGLNKAALALLARVGLAERAATSAARLSHGERKQLELAMVLAAQPKLLLLDEPLAGAGPEETARLIALLREIRMQAAILLIEHDMDAVFALADTISVLDQGRVIASGPPAAIRADAAVRAAYLGDEVPC